MTEVINIYHGGRHLGDVYIGRAGKGESGYFGNPIRVGHSCPSCGEIHRTPGSTLGCYESYLLKRLREDPSFRIGVADLAGKRLVCFCKPKPCHGDYLAKAADILSVIESWNLQEFNRCWRDYR